MVFGRSSITLHAALMICAVSLLVTSAWAAPQEKVLNSFNGATGTYPEAGLIFDQAGNLYGTTFAGGDLNACGGAGCGTVFELLPKTGGGWTEKVLHSFHAGGGSNPAASLIFDSTGNLYGTTEHGGAYGHGTVFELMPQTTGSWTEIVLHSFNNNSKDGFYPVAGVIFDGKGDIYGTTSAGGSLGGGVVFELTPERGGRWSEKLLHSFDVADKVAGPNGLAFGGNGKLYGITIDYYGSVFELTPKAGGVWSERVLHIFTGGSDGGGPTGLIVDAAGDLYGTGATGGVYYDAGVVFEFVVKAGGGFTEKVLHDFPAHRGQPMGGVTFDSAGNLYGTLSRGGPEAEGAVFELTQQSGGSWTEKSLYNFNPGGGSGDGDDPVAGLILDHAGNLYGTTMGGGTHKYGTVFEITP